jgi:hypothetical protein
VHEAPALFEFWVCVGRGGGSGQNTTEQNTDVATLL